MMKNQPPPVPPAGRTNKAPDSGRRNQAGKSRDQAKGSQGNAATGEQKNVAVNTTNQGYQQDR